MALLGVIMSAWLKLEPCFQNLLHCEVLGQRGPRGLCVDWKVAVKQQLVLSEGGHGHPW